MIKNKKIPMRSCVVTGEKTVKQELLRIVRTPDNNVVIDLTGKQNGRGAYLKKDENVIKKAQQSKIIERHLDIKVPDDLYTQMLNEIGDENE